MFCQHISEVFLDYFCISIELKRIRVEPYNLGFDEFGTSAVTSCPVGVIDHPWQHALCFCFGLVVREAVETPAGISRLNLVHTFLLVLRHLRLQ